MQTTTEQPMIETKEFKRQLESEAREHSTLKHPVFRLVMELSAAGPEKRDELVQLVRFAARETYHLTQMFERYIACLFYNCTVRSERKRLASNLYEEATGRLSQTDGHLELMERFIFAIGITEEMLEAPPTPETTELIEFRRQMVEDRAQFHKAAAAIMVASEFQNIDKVEGQMRHEFLPQVFGLTEHDMKFFTVHAKEDIAHVRDGLTMVAAACHTREMQEEALQSVRDTFDRFWGFYTGIQNNYRDAPELLAA